MKLPGFSVHQILKKAVSPPLEKSVLNGLALLESIGAIVIDRTADPMQPGAVREHLTGMGSKLIDLPVHPLLARMTLLGRLIAGARENFVNAVGSSSSTSAAFGGGFGSLFSMGSSSSMGGGFSLGGKGGRTNFAKGAKGGAARPTLDTNMERALQMIAVGAAAKPPFIRPPPDLVQQADRARQQLGWGLFSDHLLLKTAIGEFELAKTQMREEEFARGNFLDRLTLETIIQEVSSLSERLSRMRESGVFRVEAAAQHSANLAVAAAVAVPKKSSLFGPPLSVAATGFGGQQSSFGVSSSSLPLAPGGFSLGFPPPPGGPPPLSRGFSGNLPHQPLDVSTSEQEQILTRALLGASLHTVIMPMSTKHFRCLADGTAVQVGKESLVDPKTFREREREAVLMGCFFERIRSGDADKGGQVLLRDCTLFEDPLPLLLLNPTIRIKKYEERTPAPPVPLWKGKGKYGGGKYGYGKYGDHDHSSPSPPLRVLFEVSAPEDRQCDSSYFPQKSNSLLLELPSVGVASALQQLRPRLLVLLEGLVGHRSGVDRTPPETRKQAIEALRKLGDILVKSAKLYEVGGLGGKAGNPEGRFARSGGVEMTLANVNMLP